MIAAAIWLSPLFDEPIVALACGVFVAGAVQLMFQFPALMRLGLLPRPKFGFRDPGVKRIMTLMLPAIFGVSVTQINLLFDTLLASFLAVGSISWLYFSDRLVEFPLGIFGVALGVVILPKLSKSYSNDDTVAFSHSLDWGLRCVLLIGLPATIGLLLLAEPMLSTLFQYDEFGHFDVVMAGRSLMAYAVGLMGFILIKILVPGFTSRKDMKTPVRFGIYAVCANMLLNVIFIIPLAHAGLALATSVGAFFNASLLLNKLLKDKIYRPEPGWLIFLLRIFIANIAMAFLLIHYIDIDLWNDWLFMDRAMHLAFWIGAAILVYTVVLLIIGLRPRHFSYVAK
jgi:putative peptidoglycan lipid II flippase